MEEKIYEKKLKDYKLSAIAFPFFAVELLVSAGFLIETNSFFLIGLFLIGAFGSFYGSAVFKRRYKELRSMTPIQYKQKTLNWEKNIEERFYQRIFKTFKICSIIMPIFAVLILMDTILLFGRISLFLTILYLLGVVGCFCASFVFCKKRREMEKITPTEYYNKQFTTEKMKVRAERGAMITGAIVVVILLALLAGLGSCSADSTVTYFWDSNQNGKFDKGEFGYYQDNGGNYHYLD